MSSAVAMATQGPLAALQTTPASRCVLDSLKPPWGDCECVEFMPGDSSGVLCAQLSFQSIKGVDKLIADHDSGLAMQVNAFYSGCKKDTVVLLMTSGSKGSMNKAGGMMSG